MVNERAKGRGPSEVIRDRIPVDADITIKALREHGAESLGSQILLHPGHRIMLRRDDAIFDGSFVEVFAHETCGKPYLSVTARLGIGEPMVVLATIPVDRSARPPEMPLDEGGTE